MKRLAQIALAVLLSGCETNSMLPDIQQIAAKQLKKSPAEMNPKSTFSALGADDLDVVEITMAVEDKMGIAISDDELSRAAGTSPDQNLTGRLTLEAFARVAAAAPKGVRPQLRGPTGPDDGTLCESQVGTYAELAKRPNPRGYALIFIPGFDVLLASTEQKIGRPMTDSEKDELKAKAVVIALPPALADEMERKRNEGLIQKQENQTTGGTMRR
jgi:acyl carrier protein